MPDAVSSTGAQAGLSAAEAARRLARDGPNQLPEPARRPIWAALLGQLTHLLALLLWVAAALALVAGLPALSVAIVTVVLLNAVFAFWQEYRADRSAERLLALLPVRCRVVRDGSPVTVEAVELVRGDVVMLGAGDRIAADLQAGEVHGLRLDESMVTGESEPVSHEHGDTLLAGTFVVEGVGRAVVVDVGATTVLAEISRLAATATRPPSPLTVQLDRVVRVVAICAIAAGTTLGVVAVTLGLSATEAFLFGVGVTVALVPEGLLPTVTLSLARGAQQMAERQALVRRLDAVETLGATTFVCTDKTGTLTQNRMSVVEAWTAEGPAYVRGEGYAPEAVVEGSARARSRLAEAARSAAACVHGHAALREGRWVAEGDPMEAALHVLARRIGGEIRGVPQLRLPYTAARMRSSVVHDGQVHVLGAPEQVLARCHGDTSAAHEALSRLTRAGRRVVAVATTPWSGGRDADQVENDLRLLALLGLEDPPRPDVALALDSCRAAGVRVAMVTGDHRGTAEAIAREVGLLIEGPVLEGSSLPDDDRALAELLDSPGGAVVARVTPGDKLRIARVLRERGHVVAMTGDGVNDAPALREADVGVAMGASGSDVAREAADLVLLDDHFATIVTAVELGRATFTNIRRFLTYHLTDNVAELAPFAAWALSRGDFPLAIGVLQVLALDIGTDMLPALALGGEPPSRRVMRGRVRTRALVDRVLLARAFLVLGATEAAAALTAFALVLLDGGWSWGEVPATPLLASASGTAFAVIAVAQMANALACRSATRPVWRLRLLANPLLLWSIAAEGLLLLVFVGWRPLADLLGGSWPPPLGWTCAAGAALLLLGVDAASKSAAGSPRVRAHARTRVRGGATRTDA
jgi:magnesium-transporting ATPase (P-type)